jgi:hypothetical protein
MSRTRYRWSEETQSLVEIDLNAPVTARVELSTGAHYDGARASDGTPIDTPRRHREYMRRHNLALASDFEAQWRDAPAKRAQEAQTRRREDIGRTIYQLENRRHR